MHKNNPEKVTGCFKTRELWEEAVCEKLDKGITQEVIAEEVGSSRANVSHFSRSRVNYRPVQKLMTQEQMEEASEMRKTMTVKTVAKHFGVSEAYISTRKHGERDKIIKQKNNLIKTQQEILCGKW